MMTFTDGSSVPAPLAEMPDETCEIWAGVVNHATHPRVRARLHDLLFALSDDFGAQHLRDPQPEAESTS